MSGETTPRPWEIRHGAPGAYRHKGRELEEFTPICTGDGHYGSGDVDFLNPADAELIVRAVNQHDALVEFVEAAGAFAEGSQIITDASGFEWDAVSGRALRQMVRDLRAKIGGQDD